MQEGGKLVRAENDIEFVSNKDYGLLKNESVRPLINIVQREGKLNYNW